MQFIILITDSIPAANGGGISQTLFNLLDGWESPIWFVNRPGEKPVDGPVIKAQIVKYRFERLRHFGKRVLRRLNPAISKINFNRQEGLKELPAGLPTPREAFVLVSTTEPIKLHFAWVLQKKFGYTVVPYFMDDWMAGCKLKWKGNDIQRVVGDMLRQANCRMMISQNLDQILTLRYQLQARPTLVVHNPAPALSREVDKFPSSEVLKGGLRTIIYAGSIWPMHFDALKTVAKAVGIRQAQAANSQASQPAFELIIYTSDAAWQHNRKSLEGPGVIYGGFIPYAGMQAELAKGWLLLVTASFEVRYAPFTNSSVQTKLTDYMAAGKPVLFVGPAEGASGQFVHDWDCGFSIGTTNPADIAAQLEAIAALPQLSERKGQNGLAAASGYFSKPVVQERLYSFLERCVCLPAQ
ncbi:hypothetical protein BH10BAC3_BH10BAC3_33940 [soil metagenome]